MYFFFCKYSFSGAQVCRFACEMDCGGLWTRKQTDRKHTMAEYRFHGPLLIDGKSGVARLSKQYQTSPSRTKKAKDTEIDGS